MKLKCQSQVNSRVFPLARFQHRAVCINLVWEPNSHGQNTKFQQWSYFSNITIQPSQANSYDIIPQNLSSNVAQQLSAIISRLEILDGRIASVEAPHSWPVPPPAILDSVLEVEGPQRAETRILRYLIIIYVFLNFMIFLQ